MLEKVFDAVRKQLSGGFSRVSKALEGPPEPLSRRAVEGLVEAYLGLSREHAFPGEEPEKRAGSELWRDWVAVTGVSIIVSYAFAAYVVNAYRLQGKSFDVFSSAVREFFSELGMYSVMLSRRKLEAGLNRALRVIGEAWRPTAVGKSPMEALDEAIAELCERAGVEMSWSERCILAMDAVALAFLLMKRYRHLRRDRGHPSAEAAQGAVLWLFSSEGREAFDALSTFMYVEFMEKALAALFEQVLKKKEEGKG